MKAIVKVGRGNINPNFTPKRIEDMNTRKHLINSGIVIPANKVKATHTFSPSAQLILDGVLTPANTLTLSGDELIAWEMALEADRIAAAQDDMEDAFLRHCNAQLADENADSSDIAERNELEQHYLEVEQTFANN